MNLKLYTLFGSAYSKHPDEPLAYEFSQTFQTREDAAEFKKRFSRACAFKSGPTTGGRGWVSSQAKLIRDGVIGDRNEAGIARYWRILAECRKLGIEIEYQPGAGNSYPSRADFEAAISKD